HDRDGKIGAFQVVRAKAALREADEIDARKDKTDLLLAGVPVAIKDNVAVAGEPMRVGSLGSDAAPQPRDHDIVRRLRAAGAVVVGITRVPELCVFGATDSAFGITHNPWDLDRTPGGSSGGAAAAVASGMVPIAHGNDGMGSIRIPSACCGLVGLKPGLGVLPAGIGNGDWFGMAENGPIATTVQDAATVFAVMADVRPFVNVRRPNHVRIATSTRAPMLGTPVDKHWRAAVGKAGLLLREAGHTVEADDPPYSIRTLVSEIGRWSAGTELDAQLLADRSRLERRLKSFTKLGRRAMKLGLAGPEGRARWQRAAESFFEEHDVLITPTLAQPPIRSVAWGQRGMVANIWSNSHYAPFAAPWNLAGWPAMAVPAGVHPTGTPLSVQLVTKPGGEMTLLGLAGVLEGAQPWPRIAPGYADA
ncbi:MAG TPA: amidase family protein, partial [Jatrophihabitantaceae bacterium]|nr:amidase family protein [Jatrophihabitantaceae bacterium]